MAPRKPKVVVTRKLPDAIETRMRELFDTELNLDDTPMDASALVAAMTRADVLASTITDRLDASVIERAGDRLKLIANFGVGVDHIDVEAATARGITVTNTPGVLTDDTADLTMGLILELTRNIGRESARMHAGEPLQKFVGIEIEGRTLGVLGLGKLGAKVSGLAKAFGMNVIAWSPNLTAERCKEVGVSYASKEELFATADIITVHVVLSQRSRGLVGREDLARMKPTSYLVNTARGPIVDEEALLETLQNKKIAGAAVDVFSIEPLPVSHPFRKLDNLVLTPHLGYVTEEGFRNHYAQMVEGIDAWFKGAPVRRLA